MAKMGTHKLKNPTEPLKRHLELNNKIITTVPKCWDGGCMRLTMGRVVEPEEALGLRLGLSKKCDNISCEENFHSMRLNHKQTQIIRDVADIITTFHHHHQSKLLRGIHKLC